MKRRAWQTFFRVLSLSLACVALPTMLICGITVADRKTREVGFSDREPVFYAENTNNGDVTLHAFGDEIRIDSAITDAAGRAWQVCKTAVPHAVKTGAALIERIVDRILRLVSPTG